MNKRLIVAIIVGVLATLFAIDVAAHAILDLEASLILGNLFTVNCGSELGGFLHGLGAECGHCPGQSIC